MLMLMSRCCNRGPCGGLQCEQNTDKQHSRCIHDYLHVIKVRQQLDLGSTQHQIVSDKYKQISKTPKIQLTTTISNQF